MQLAALIIVMLAIVTVSYRQTIKAYPMGASSYIVRQRQPGRPAGLVALGAAHRLHGDRGGLGIGRRGWPSPPSCQQLDAYKVPISVAIVALLMLGNLRGIRESGTIFMAPTYLYIVVDAGRHRVGPGAALTGTLPPFTPPPDGSNIGRRAARHLGLFLILRAFSQGRSPSPASRPSPTACPPSSHPSGRMRARR